MLSLPGGYTRAAAAKGAELLPCAGRGSEGGAAGRPSPGSRKRLHSRGLRGRLRRRGAGGAADAGARSLCAQEELAGHTWYRA